MLAARAGLVPGLPLMHPAFYIRPARVEEAAALSDLCFRSKAVWGYDPEFMALMLAALGGRRRGHRCRRCVGRDRGRRADCRRRRTRARRCARCAGLEQAVHRTAPYSQRRRPCAAEARRRGAGRLTILADPNAAAFYERAGAVRIGEAPSDAVPGRLLPLYEVRLDSTGDRDLEPHLGGISKR